MNRLVALTLTALAAAGAARAQGLTYIADPLDNGTSSTGNVIPLAASSSFDESRCHYFFPAQFLPGTGGAIVGLEFSIQSAATIPYQLLEFSLDHSQATGLSTTFANNLTAPQLVYSIANQVEVRTNGWNRIDFQTPFFYDGASSLVVESRKIVDRPAGPTGSGATRVLVWPRRTDTVPPVWAYGTFGSGQSSAAVANTTYNTEVIMRLIFRGATTLTIDSTRNTTGNTSRAFYHIGATVTLTTQGTPNAPMGTFFEAAILPAGVSIPGFGGELWLPTLSFLVDSGALDGSGLRSFSANIPSDPTLVGLQAYFQSLVLGSTIDFTNVVLAPVAAF